MLHIEHFCQKFFVARCLRRNYDYLAVFTESSSFVVGSHTDTHTHTQNFLLQASDFQFTQCLSPDGGSPDTGRIKKDFQVRKV